MFCRYFLFFFLIFHAVSSLADTGAPAWNCSQNEKGEWLCITQSQKGPYKSMPQLPEAQTPSGSSPTIAEPEVPEGIQDDEGEEAVTKIPTPVPVEAHAEPVPIPVSIVPPKTEPDQAGWTCEANQETESWNCNLIGPDPRGQAKVMDEGTGFSLLDPAFDSLQEQTFKTLQADLKYDPWRSCTFGLGKPPDLASEKGLRAEAPLDVGADYTEIFDKEIASFMGNVHMSRADQYVRSNMATYDTVSETLDMQGNVYYGEEDFSIFGDSALLRLGEDQAILRNALFLSPATPLRGSASAVYRENTILSQLNEVAFTSCAPGNRDWVMHASRLKMNKQTGKGSAKHAWLEFKGVPVLYLPYVSFPLDDRRQSGLLAPGFGSTEQGGVDFKVPYYWNIAPNYDAITWARYLTKRGGMLGGDFRYLTEMTEGSIEAEVLPYDLEREETRWQGSLKNRTRYTENLRSNIDINYVSDEEYFDELGNSLSFNRNRFLYSFADVLYDRPGVALSVKADNYQSIDNTIPDVAKPYRRLPQALANLQHSFDFMPLETKLGSEFVFFEHSDRVDGPRFNVRPSVSVPWKTPGSFVNPKISVDYTQYWLSDQIEGRASNINRTLPMFSLDSGIFIDKEFGDSFVHTIEPRLFYLYIPETNQDDIPLFDTSDFDFTFSQLFRENRFNGIDRIGDANQMTVALTSRLIDAESGRENLNLSVGNIIYFEDRKVNLVRGVTETGTFSNIIAEMNGQLTENFSFQSGMQWDPESGKFDRGEASIRYRNKLNHIFNLGYRLRQNNPIEANNLEQTNISFRLPIYDSWHLVGRWQYSILRDTTLESFVGLEKESCCWRFRVLGRKFIKNINSIETGEGELDTGFFIQLELKGLANFGDKVEDFLEKNLNGYRILKN